MEDLHDVVVVLPGIMGSVLRDEHGDVWKLSARTILRGLMTRGRAVKRLELPEGIGDNSPSDGVEATALMPDMHVIPGIWTVNVGYERLIGWFHNTFDVAESDPNEPERVVNFVQFPYDWRLSNRYNATVLQHAVEPVLERFQTKPGHENAKLIFVGHSMGGLIARYYVDVLGGHEVTKKVITLGTPHRGSLNALVTLVNGVRKRLGPIGLDLTAVARSLPSLHQLLPEYACIDDGDDHLRKTTETTVPELDTAMVEDAMRFHMQLSAGAAAHAFTYDAHPILGRTQPTDTTGRIKNGQVETLPTIRIRNERGEYEDQDQKGDGTVPRLSAAPYGVASNSPILRYVMEKHGALPMNDPVLTEMHGVLTGSEIIPRPPAIDLGVSADDVLVAGEDLHVTIESDPNVVVEATVVDGSSGKVRTSQVAVHQGDGRFMTSFSGLPPGFYELRAGVSGLSSENTVATPLVVIDIEEAPA